MNKKKVLLSVVALLLVCALSVAGTLAVLSKTTGTLKNTFIASATPDNFVDALDLKEYAVTPDGKGGYTQGTNELVADKEATTDIGNNYKMVPGLEIPKEVFVELKRDNETPAYLYIEVVAVNMDDYTYSVDATRWVELTGVTGNNGGKVYVYGANNTATPIGAVATAEQYDILTGNKVTANDMENVQANETGTLTFYAYFAQATVAVTEGGVTSNTSDAAKVFNTCFPNP